MTVKWGRRKMIPAPSENNPRHQGPKGMPDQEISVQNKDKQPKNLKK